MQYKNNSNMHNENIYFFKLCDEHGKRFEIEYRTLL